MQYKLEIACNNFESCINAELGYADRIELVENISNGGCTPSYGMIKRVKEKINIPIYVMIRPRGGDFVYSKEDLEIMKSDIKVCHVLGVDGIVFGILNNEGHIDCEICSEFLNLWQNKPATFHRAIDRTIDLEKSIEEIIQMGFERVLTSGGGKNVDDGMEAIKSLQNKYGNKICIMPGSGVTPKNSIILKNYCQVNEIHATCKTIKLNDKINNNPIFIDEYEVSNLKLIIELNNSFKNIEN